MFYSKFLNKLTCIRNVLAEEMEATTHLDARLITTNVMIEQGYEAEGNYYVRIKWNYGRQPAKIINCDVEEEYYHECDLWCRKTHSTGLTEEIFIEFDGEDTRHEYEDEDGSKRPPLNSSKYVYKKQKGNDIDFERWLRFTKPDAIFIRINKEDIIKRKDSSSEIYSYIRSKVKKSIVDFIT